MKQVVLLLESQFRILIIRNLFSFSSLVIHISILPPPFLFHLFQFQWYLSNTCNKPLISIDPTPKAIHVGAHRQSRRRSPASHFLAFPAPFHEAFDRLFALLFLLRSQFLIKKIPIRQDRMTQRTPCSLTPDIKGGGVRRGGCWQGLTKEQIRRKNKRDRRQTRSAWGNFQKRKQAVTFLLGHAFPLSS